MREVGAEVAVAPRIQRVPVARDAADDALDLGARFRRERRELEVVRRGQIEDQLRLSAGRRQDGQAAPTRPALGLAGGEHLRHLVHVGDLDRAMRAENFGKDARFAGEAARVRGDRAPRALAPPDLEDDDRLAVIGGTVERGHEALGLAHGLEEHRDDARGRIVDQVFEEIDRRQDRLVAGRDHLAKAETPAVGEQADADGAALRDQPDVAREQRRILEGTQIDEARDVRAHDAHAVRAAERDAGLAADGRDLLLVPAPLGVRFREAAVEDDGGADATLGHRPHVLEHARVIDAERQHVDVAGKLGDGRVAPPAEDRVVPRVDRIDRAGEAHGVERLDQRAPDRWTLGGAEDRDRAGTEERIKTHGRFFPS